MILLHSQDNNFNPRSPSGERRLASLKYSWLVPISIHALQAESDLTAILTIDFTSGYFNPRSPSGERLDSKKKFQVGFKISIHALQAESDRLISLIIVDVGNISIHALQAESDKCISPHMRITLRFQSTLSKRRATFDNLVWISLVLISIHALQAESDAVDWWFRYDL